MTATDPAATFEPHRRHLTGLAYRMLGSVADAQDMVQEAFLRWLAAGREEVADARAFLSRTVTRLCLDQLRSARHRRELYVGPWLPEPLVADLAVPAADAMAAGHAADDLAHDLAHDLSVALLLALERLSPLERAAFLLHDVFEQEFGAVAETLGRSPAACRQLAARARTHVQAARPRYRVPAGQGERLARAFAEASRSGDLTALSRLLADDAVLEADGGGKRAAALNPIIGGDRIARFFAGLARKGLLAAAAVHPARINGLPGFLLVEDGTVIQTTALEMADGRITRLYIVRNPDKLRHLARPDGAPGTDAAGPASL